MIRLLNVQTLELEEIDDGSDAPPYLILSHRWGKPYEEVSFKDMEAPGRRFLDKKAWERKVKGFSHLARKHDFDYVWINTCCIDKSSSSELNYAINCMFRWYQKAAACVVHLDDVQQDEHPQWDDDYATIPVWYTRGWTLQELLAPKVVRFYNRDWTFIGTRATLAPQIHGFTGIEEDALHGKDLHAFSFLQRFRWAQDRETSRPEDMIYSLLGLFGVTMHDLYGEVETGALLRLIEHSGKMTKFPREREENVPNAVSITQRSHAAARYVHFLETPEDNRAGAVSTRTGKRPSAGFRPITEDWRVHSLSNIGNSAGGKTVAGQEGASQEKRRHSTNFTRRITSIIDDYNGEGYGGNVSRPLHGPISRYEAQPSSALPFYRNRDAGRRQDRDLKHREGLWTWISNDLVVEEAIQEMDHEFLKTDHSYYIFRDLTDQKIYHLIRLSDDNANIGAGGSKRLKGKIDICAIQLWNSQDDSPLNIHRRGLATLGTNDGRHF